MVAKRQPKQEPSVLALVPDRAPEGDKALQERATKALREVADLALSKIERANAGDAQTLAELKALLNDHPMVSKLVSTLSHNAEWAVMGAMGLDEQPGAKAVTQAQIDAMRREVRGEHPSALEKMLVDRLILDWLFAIYHDTKYATACQKGMSFAEGEYWQKARERSSRQLAATTKALATVRAAQAPALAMIVNP